ncbi:hypothetical protein QNM99_12100 [Pseudomonas sp. PCH446]
MSDGFADCLRPAIGHLTRPPQTLICRLSVQSFTKHLIIHIFDFSYMIEGAAMAIRSRVLFSRFSSSVVLQAGDFYPSVTSNKHDAVLHTVYAVNECIKMFASVKNKR